MTSLIAGTCAIIALWIGIWIGSRRSISETRRYFPELYDKLTSEEGRVFYVTAITHNRIASSDDFSTTVDLLDSQHAP